MEKQNKKTQVQKCCICGKTFQGWGNDEHVIPARLKVLYGFKF